MARDPALLQKVVERAPDLPTLPVVLNRVQQALADPGVSAGRIGEIIHEDQALTARMLKLVNSAYYGFPQKINSVTRAIVILGFHKVREILLTASVFEAFQQGGHGGKAGAPTSFDATGFWMHSLGTAVASQAVAVHLRMPSADEAFVAGLLHDIGKVVLAQHLKPEYAEVAALVEGEGILMVRAEERVMTLNHTSIGRWMVERWNFPPSLVAPIRFHHTPALAREHRELVHAVHLGDILARALELGNGGDAGIPEIDPVVWQHNNLSLPALDKCMTETRSGFQKSGAFVELLQGKGQAA